MSRYLWPLAGFILLVILFAVGLTKDPRKIPSPLIDKSAPAFELPKLHAPAERFSPTTMKGQVWLLNVWASWCAACLTEHPVLLELQRAGHTPIVGLNYKDEAQAAFAWLVRHGDPYALSVMDADGRVGIDYGVYGVPETFVIDKDGTIRYKHIGPLTREALAQNILPLVQKLQR